MEEVKYVSNVYGLVGLVTMLWAMADISLGAESLGDI
jgi:hypothetical protein